MDRAVLAMWTIYDHPRDYPTGFIARKWLVTKGSADPVWTRETLTASTLRPLQEHFHRHGLVRIARAPQDDPRIVETWL